MVRLSCSLMERKKCDLECKCHLETVKLQAEERGVPSTVLGRGLNEYDQPICSEHLVHAKHYCKLLYVLSLVSHFL